MSERVTNYVELTGGQVLDVHAIVYLGELEECERDGTATLVLRYRNGIVTERVGKLDMVREDHRRIKRAMLGPQSSEDYCVACELRFTDVQGEFRVDEHQTWMDNQYVSRSQLVGEMTTTKMHFLGATIEVAIPDSISATFVVTELMLARPGYELSHYRTYRVKSSGIYWYNEKLRTDKMLTQPPSEPPIPHDQPMHGRCFTCSAVVECKFSDCKVVDDPPLGRVATVACPNRIPHNKGDMDKCGAVVRMAQTRGAK